MAGTHPYLLLDLLQGAYVARFIELRHRVVKLGHIPGCRLARRMLLQAQKPGHESTCCPGYPFHAPIQSFIQAHHVSRWRPPLTSES